MPLDGQGASATRPCPYCDGTGKGIVDDWAAMGYKTPPCAECDGTGQRATTGIAVDGATAIVHGSQPMTPESQAAVESVVRAAAAMLDDPHSWALVADEDPLEHEVCTLCGAQRNTDGPVAERATITGGWPLEDCEKHPLLAKRIKWERANPRPEQLRRVEKAIVVALNDAEFGDQSQVTRSDGFDIAVDDLIIRVEYRPEARSA